MTKQILIVLLLSVFFASSCVTQTERLPYRRYAPPPEDEGIIEELRREFGWQSSPSPYGSGGDPFYKRAAQGVKKTVSGWFQREEVPGAMTQEERERARREFEQERHEALRRLRERQEQERSGY